MKEHLRDKAVCLFMGVRGASSQYKCRTGWVGRLVDEEAPQRWGSVPLCVLRHQLPMQVQGGLSRQAYQYSRRSPLWSWRRCQCWAESGSGRGAGWDSCAAGCYQSSRCWPVSSAPGCPRPFYSWLCGNSPFPPHYCHHSITHCIKLHRIINIMLINSQSHWCH